MRIARLREAIARQGLDAAAFISEGFDPQIFYLTGFDGSGALVVPKESPPFLVVPQMYEGRAKKSGVDVVVKGSDYIRGIGSFCKERGMRIASMGVDFRRMSIGDAMYLKGIWGDLADISPVLASMRCVKDDAEVGLIKKACRISDKIVSEVVDSWGDFETEADVSAFIEMKARKIGLPCPFHAIVASGSNARDPHHRAKSVRMSRGPVVIDFGVRYEGYCSDISRTVCVGPPSDGIKKAYEAVKTAQLHAIASIKKGRPCKDIDALARKALGPLAEGFIHGLGHGIGVEVHEHPTINSSSCESFKEGMVFTIEPGIYTGSFGIRIEDDVLLCEKGAELLTDFDRDLIVL